MLLLLVAGQTSAQEFRGGITGTRHRQSKGRLPGVTVTATNVATNVASTTTTNGEGDYTILYPHARHLHVDGRAVRLQEDGPGRARGPHRRQARGRSTLDVGRLEETVSVTAESPLLETT